MALAFCKTLSTQSLGFTYGKPQRVDEKSLTVILPILRETSLSRDYITYPESEKILAFDTGRIDRMQVENKTDSNVFIRSGTLFRGKTQERTTVRSTVIFPGKMVEVEVRCVHATRGIRGQTEVKYGGLTPHSFDKKNYDPGFTPKAQHTYWANVQDTTKMYAANSVTGKDVSSTWQAHADGLKRRAKAAARSADFGGIGGQCIGGPISWDESSVESPLKSDNLVEHMDKFATSFDSVLSKVKCHDTQVGVALILDTGVELIEAFDHKDSWKALHESAVKRMGAELVKEDKDSLFEFKPDKAVKMVDEVLAMDFDVNTIWHHRPSNGEPEVRIRGLTAKDYVGEVVEIGDRTVHLVILKTT